MEPVPASQTRGALADNARVPTCITGVITTSGVVEIPVARAHVTVARGSLTLGQTTTDDNGHFTWCAPRTVEGSVVRTNVHVEKAAFATSERELEIPAGTTTELSIGLNPNP